MRFDQTYNQQDFLYFLEDFLPEDFVEKEEDILINKDRYKEITKARILGFSEFLDLHVLEMDHGHEHDSRIAIATDAFKVLADHWIHKALVVFKNKDSENYRLSYLTISLDLNDKNRAVKRYSNARRYSFYLGVNAKIRTPEQQLIKKGKVKDAEDLLSRFSVEVVNKQFYLEVAKFFDELVSSEDNNLTLPGVSHADTNTRKSFAVRLIGRTMFCWFLKQKKSDNGQLIPDGLLSSKIVTDNYYHSTLEPLFFGVLNTSIESRDIRSDLFDKVPYLNGGLFNPQSDDYYELDRGTFTSKHINTLKISDSWFRGFFELLETYNFTIDENTVFDQELSVDPEMLGRIFENLLAEINPETGSSERKRTGSFYTPRQIVEYMVDQSLIEYLKTKTGIEEKKLSALVSYDLTDDADYPLNDSEKRAVINAVESLKILDPACGSGAYPIGALQKIVYVLQQIDPDCKMWLEQKLKGVPELYKQKIINEVKSNPFDYTRKLDVIKNSIFGVDIQPIAVDVSRLRCFLTLVVESEVDDAKPNRGIEPLPNLDFKFVCANTLIGLPKSQSSNLFEDHSGIIELSKIMSEYFSCNSQRKNEIKLKFINLQKEILEKTISAFGKNTGELTLKLTTWNPFSNASNSWFDPEWMFGLENKFDIVIANPPYVFSRENLSDEQKQLFKKQYILTEFKLNLYVLFIEKSFNLLNTDGVLSFIIPNNWLTLSTASKLRHYILTNTYNTKIVLHHDQVFKSASVDTCLLIFTKSGEKLFSFYSWDIDGVKLTTKKSPEYFLRNNSYIFSNIGATSESNQEILLKINSKSEELGKVCEVRNGVQAYTVGEGNPIQSKEIKNERSYHSNVKHDQNWIEYLDGADIERYNIKWSGQFIKYGKNLSRPRDPELFDGERILIRQIPALPPYCIVASYFTDQAVVDNNCLVVKIEDPAFNIKYVLAILNSRLVSYWFIYTFGKLQRKTFPQFKVKELRMFPIIRIDNASQQQYVKIVDQIFKIKSSKNYLQSSDQQVQVKELENQIDELVMDLYGLTEKEKEIIRN